MDSRAAGRRGSGAAAVTLREHSDWYLWIDEIPRPGWANMAIDHALLERAEQPGESWLRLYQWAPHCLSFGRHEPAKRRYDPERITELGLDTVRRPTGGRAVWHAQELTYAVAAPSVRFGSLHAAYLEIHGMLADALRGVGVRATLAPAVRTPALDMGPCFSQPVGGEIMIGRRKIVGSAQLRQESALLQHGSILLEDNQSFVLGLMRDAIVPQSSPRYPQLMKAWGMAKPLRNGEVAEAVTRAAGDRWHGKWQRVSDFDAVLRCASSLYPHYRSAAWTWAR